MRRHASLTLSTMVTALAAVIMLGLAACQPAPSKAVQVDAVMTHACAVLANGTVKCWGNNRSGQLGNGVRLDKPNTAVQVTGIKNAKQVAVGHDVTCALLTSGAVDCWGMGTTGQLGNGSTASSSVAVPVAGITTATSVSITDGSYPTGCASLADGHVRCWGANQYGNLGNSSTPLGTSGTGIATVPVTVDGLTDAVTVSAGNDHVCARRSTGEVACWGRNVAGELGNASVPVSGASAAGARSPVPVTGLTGVTEVSAGGSVTCATTAGAAQCWGSDFQGQLGDGTRTNSVVPVPVTGGLALHDLDAGGAPCAIASSKVYCWGPNSFNQLGNTDIPNTGQLGSLIGSTRPVPVMGITSAPVDVAAGDLTSCAALSTGRVVCWGSNQAGALGTGNTTTALVATPVTGV